jgi:hypothetical protein
MLTLRLKRRLLCVFSSKHFQTCSSWHVWLHFPCLFVERGSDVQNQIMKERWPFQVKAEKDNNGYNCCIRTTCLWSTCVLCDTLDSTHNRLLFHSSLTIKLTTIHWHEHPQTERRTRVNLLSSSWILSTEVAVQTYMFHFLCSNKNTLKYWWGGSVLVKFRIKRVRECAQPLPAYPVVMPLAHIQICRWLQPSRWKWVHFEYIMLT